MFIKIIMWFKNNWMLLARLGLTLLVLILLFVLYLFIPSNSLRYQNLQPINDYKTALQQVEQEMLVDKDLVGDNCKSILLTHGNKTDNVIVFLHGYTSCPGQFKELGQVLYDAGYNVYIPRAPYHGYKEKDTRAIDSLTSSKYAEYAEKAVQLAHGLGNKVSVSGLSGGGNLTSWIAINDSSIEKAIVISPGYGFSAIPGNLTTPASKLFAILPSFYVLYDQNNPKGDSNSDVYAGYTTKSLANVLSVGQRTYRDLLKPKIAAKNITFIINDNDNQISLEAFKEVKAVLEDNKEVNFKSYTFVKSLNLGHDFLDPNFNQSTKASSYQEIKKVILE